MCDSLKFGVSADLTLAWLDILIQGEDMYNPSSIQPPNEQLIAINAPPSFRLPIVLVCSGTGSFYSPFHLDPGDIYIKSFTQLFGSNWIKFIRSCNAHLRTIQTSQVFNQNALKSTLNFLKYTNAIGIGNIFIYKFELHFTYDYSIQLISFFVFVSHFV
jgi:hypothetical protein